ncbi:MAG: Holliday junction branch migration protein RuvA [Acidobacteria bacterium]|nr:Holliday junction branch migration protein RuvA [Acidobacteriota bacterium]MCB9396408.1 Holliday junction branch migration protein RuvA [Acidobacteriota bacterium]
MIGSLNGTLTHLEDAFALVEVNGVGYEVFIGKGPRFSLPPVGSSVRLYIHTHVREDQIALFGFPSPAHRALFKKLNTVTGVGPKLAFAVVATLSPKAIVDALILGDVRSLSSVSGVGKKMAERMVLDLKSQLDDLALLVGTASPGETPGLAPVWLDLTNALSGLGFPEAKIRNVIRLLQAEAEPDSDLNALLKLALQKINQC